MNLSNENLASGSTPLPPAAILEKALPIRDWLVNEATLVESSAAAFEGFCERVVEAGVPIDRAVLTVEILHSEHSGIGWFWQPGDSSEQRIFPYGAQREEVFKRSPFYEVQQTGEWINLCLAETADDRFGIVPDLKEAGFVHYLCIPLPFLSTRANAVTFATKTADGFSDDHIALLKTVLPALRVTAEVIALNNRISTVLKTYVGSEPHKHILAGDIHRGEVMRIRSAILFVDMRGFTSHTLSMNADEVAEFLNRFYDCVVPGVERHNGEVLKFIGDGVLAIFRSEEGGDAEACRRALLAAAEVLDAVNRERQQGPGPRFDVKVALHFGDVAYGNVGSGQRLDFTVMGKGVNIASRLSDLCGTLQRRMLVTGDFRACLADEMEFTPAGTWELRGVANEQDVYEPPV